jgi:PBP1b-binding outer membrane lipoprotein LpoB
MNLPNVRASAALLALVTLLTLILTGCSGSSQGGAQETDAQKAKRLAIIQQHKDAADSGH